MFEVWFLFKSRHLGKKSRRKGVGYRFLTPIPLPPSPTPFQSNRPHVTVWLSPGSGSRVGERKGVRYECHVANRDKSHPENALRKEEPPVTLVGTTQGLTNVQILASLRFNANATGSAVLTSSTHTFDTIQELINAAVAELKLKPNTTTTSVDRTFEKALKDCFDAINNGQGQNLFVL
jgi:hypothetical protein